MKGRARSMDTASAIFYCFFTEDMIQTITDHTNRYIQLQPNYSREWNVSKTDPTEIKALIGLLFLGGLLRSSHVNCRDLWSTNGTGVDRFPATMSMYRFQFLLRCLRFYNIETDEGYVIT